MDERKVEDITVTLVREVKPAGLLQYFHVHRIRITNPFPGIYYVLKGVPFRTQIIVTSELSAEGHVWLKALSDQMNPDSLRDFWEQIQGISGKYDRELADAVLEVCTRANWETIRELRGGGKEMCQAMLELMEPEINQIRKETAEKAATDATRKAEEAAAEAIKKATQKVEKIEKSARREAVHTVKSLLKSGKLSAEEIAGCVPRLSLDEIRAIAAGIARA